MELVLIAVATLGGVGIVFGALLALAARVFAVETDPRVDEVREVLPGANCGACGFPGCTGFAESVVKGKAPVEACIPGGNDTAQAIAAILGREVSGIKPMVAAVFCIGGRGKAHERFIYDGIPDCTVAEKYGGGFKACPYGCLGLGNCVKACPFDAITMLPEGLPAVNEGLCVGCGLCAGACPRGIIKIIPRDEAGYLVLCSSHDRGKAVSQACTVGCTACKACIRVCEQEAITIEDDLAVINLERCNSCGACAAKCRPGAIHLIHPHRRETPAEQPAAAAAAIKG